MTCQRCQIQINSENVALNDSIDYNDLPERAKTEELIKVKTILCGECKREFLELMDDFLNKKPTKADFKKRLTKMVSEGGKGRLSSLTALNELVKAKK